jgi:hypothetical protein
VLVVDEVQPNDDPVKHRDDGQSPILQLLSPFPPTGLPLKA